MTHTHTHTATARALELDPVVARPGYGPGGGFEHRLGGLALGAHDAAGGLSARRRGRLVRLPGLFGVAVTKPAVLEADPARRWRDERARLGLTVLDLLQLRRPDDELGLESLVLELALLVMCVAGAEDALGGFLAAKNFGTVETPVFEGAVTGVALGLGGLLLPGLGVAEPAVARVLAGLEAPGWSGQRTRRQTAGSSWLRGCGCCCCCCGGGRAGRRGRLLHTLALGTPALLLQ